MAAAGTLISDLDSQQGGNDGDIVQKILSDMSIPSPSNNQRPVPPPMPQAQQMIAPQMQGGSVTGMTMDNQIPMAHMIGNQHPTSADFAAAMNGMNIGANTNMNGAPYQTMPGVGVVNKQYEPPTKNFYGRVADEIKIPFVVAVLFFLFSLPPIRVLVAHYIPSMIKNTGEFTITGLLVVSGVVGLVFWILQRVIAPLLSL
jgi:hypothetical protein